MKSKLEFGWLRTPGAWAIIGMSGAEGTIAAFGDLNAKRRVFLHINNSNPVLLADSPERRETEAAGWEIAYDGMEVRL